MESVEMTWEETLERWQEATEALRPSFEALRKAIEQAWLVIEEQLRILIAALSEWLEEIRREELYRRLRRWRVPYRLARFVARRWPRRWLPWLERIA